MKEFCKECWIPTELALYTVGESGTGYNKGSAIRELSEAKKGMGKKQQCARCVSNLIGQINNNGISGAGRDVRV